MGARDSKVQSPRPVARRRARASFLRDAAPFLLGVAAPPQRRSGRFTSPAGGLVGLPWLLSFPWEGRGSPGKSRRVFLDNSGGAGRRRAIGRTGPGVRRNTRPPRKALFPRKSLPNRPESMQFLRAVPGNAPAPGGPVPRRIQPFAPQAITARKIGVRVGWGLQCPRRFRNRGARAMARKMLSLKYRILATSRLTASDRRRPPLPAAPGRGFQTHNTNHALPDGGGAA